MSNSESIMLTLSPSLSPPTEHADTISTLIVCKICLLDYTLEQMYSISQCHCTFCVECVKTYINTSIDNGNVLSISCPNLYCRLHGEIGQSEVKALVSADMFDRYCRLRFEQEIEFDPTRTFCPKPQCRAVCPVLPVPGNVTGTVTFADNNARPINCPECGMQFCLQCKSAWHDKQTCDENMIKVEGVVYGIPFFSFAEDAKIKRCPTCHVPIERNSGCAQMMCRRCKHVFCWYCLASLDDDFLLRHYDRGRCKNKLGHSRASVLFHRMQVVGIFAGFGILLLIVSPFLLLAVPCLLCSGCRPCRRCDDFDITTDGSGTTQPPPAASL